MDFPVVAFFSVISRARYLKSAILFCLWAEYRNRFWSPFVNILAKYIQTTLFWNLHLTSKQNQKPNSHQQDRCAWNTKTDFVWVEHSGTITYWTVSAFSFIMPSRDRNSWPFQRTTDLFQNRWLRKLYIFSYDSWIQMQNHDALGRNVCIKVTKS